MTQAGYAGAARIFHLGLPDALSESSAFIDKVDGLAESRAIEMFFTPHDGSEPDPTLFDTTTCELAHLRPHVAVMPTTYCWTDHDRPMFATSEARSSKNPLPCEQSHSSRAIALGDPTLRSIAANEPAGGAIALRLTTLMYRRPAGPPAALKAQAELPLPC